MTDHDDTPAWTIEGMPQWQQQIIMRTARREDMTIAEFVWNTFQIGWWPQGSTGQWPPNDAALDGLEVNPELLEDLDVVLKAGQPEQA